MAKKYELVSVEDIVKIAAETAAKVTLEEHERFVKAERKAFVDRRFDRTKQLLNDYRNLKACCEAAVYDSAESVSKHDVVRELMEQRDSGRITSVVRSVQRTQTLLTHIDSCLAAFRAVCAATGRERQARVIDGLYIDDVKLSASELADREYTTERTIYNKVKAAVPVLATLFFGVYY